MTPAATDLAGDRRRSKSKLGAVLAITAALTAAGGALATRSAFASTAVVGRPVQRGTASVPLCRFGSYSIGFEPAPTEAARIPAARAAKLMRGDRSFPWKASLGFAAGTGAAPVLAWRITYDVPRTVLPAAVTGAHACSFTGVAAYVSATTGELLGSEPTS